MNPIQELKDSLQQAIVHALEYAKNEGAINYEQVPEFVIEVPADKGHGDFAANIAMLLARQARMAPRKIAEIIVRHLTVAQPVEKVEVAGAGFINFFLNPSCAPGPERKYTNPTFSFPSVWAFAGANERSRPTATHITERMQVCI